MLSSSRVRRVGKRTLVSIPQLTLPAKALPGQGNRIKMKLRNIDYFPHKFRNL